MNRKFLISVVGAASLVGCILASSVQASIQLAAVDDPEITGSWAQKFTLTGTEPDPIYQINVSENNGLSGFEIPGDRPLPPNWGYLSGFDTTSVCVMIANQTSNNGTSTNNFAYAISLPVTFQVWFSSTTPTDQSFFFAAYGVEGTNTRYAEYDNVSYKASTNTWTITNSNSAPDDVSLVPEPTTALVWSLLGTLAIGLGWWRRRKAA